MAQGYSINIGLNAVDPHHYAGWDGQLQACEADAEDMVSIAKSQEFSRVRPFMTKDATRAAVLAELGEAASVLQAGDLLLFTYSGHGGQLPDINGEESDGLDETWCLYDGELVDDEIYQAMSKLKAGVRVFMLSDSCHSGTVSRVAYAALRSSGSLQLLADTVQSTHHSERRFKEMPLGIEQRTYRDNKAMYDAILKGLPKEDPKLTLKATVMLISGCQDNQLSSDGVFNGLFTSNLLRVWNGGKFKASYPTFHRRILRTMPPIQSPAYSIIGVPSREFERQVPFRVN
ncbi:caspase family protein [Corallococcus aberystwythensis]|uniref:Caspase family protein n=1 Tax=Corallococcus aberystwythensis TaxID=2316722 RepID=A0A3A8Q9L0_9BACT|nr:caspase family protein [Corallococcus aberystwythensis]RKH61432.1 caspase family protein [Corallococcus aberystwythensis]